MTAGANSYGYDANGNMTTRNGSTINYASYNLPTSIASGANSSTLAYGAWRNTVKQVAVTSGTTETTVYVAGLLEKVTKGTTTEYRHRIDATPGTVAIYTRKSSGSNATYYLHRDHLGSPEMITNASGNSVGKLSFSAYGERRDVDWDGPITSSHLTSAANVTRHGYTDHLHLDSVKLVHMGGRVYDPVIGRFLSRDPYIDGVASSQGANGYAYVWNNPLTRWDPTGYGGTKDGIEVKNWCNDVCGDPVERIVVTGRQSYWELTSTLIAHEFRLALIGSGASGSGGESGGGGSGSGGDSGPEGTKEEEPKQCVDKVQLALGAMTTVAGTLQMTEGLFVTLVGLAAVPAPGVNIGSPVAIAFGTANIVVGGANAVDGVNQMLGAVGGADHRSILGVMGQAIGGDRGGQVGDAASILANAALGIPGLARSVTASNRAGEYALANFAFDTGTGVAAEGAGSRCP